MITSTEIIQELKVQAKIDQAYEIEHRKTFIKNQLKHAKLKCLVLGISGGIDSTTLGKLAQLAIDELNTESGGYQFVAVRLPYANQADEADAQTAIEFIQPTKVLTLNIKSATDALHNATIDTLQQQQVLTESKSLLDFNKGNVKARMRMAAQYEIAGLLGGLVLGTDHSAENLTGFFTKWGDGACDLIPLFGLNKRQIRQIAASLGAPSILINKAPTADLECLVPSKTDEAALGISYDEIDDFLEAKTVDQKVSEKLVRLYNQTNHKRQMIPTIYSH